MHTPNGQPGRSVPASSKGVCNIRSSLELPCRFTVRHSTGNDEQIFGAE
jgi:hypothetical protein